MGGLAADHPACGLFARRRLLLVVSFLFLFPQTALAQRAASYTHDRVRCPPACSTPIAWYRACISCIRIPSGALDVAARERVHPPTASAGARCRHQVCPSTQPPAATCPLLSLRSLYHAPPRAVLPTPSGPTPIAARHGADRMGRVWGGTPRARAESLSELPESTTRQQQAAAARRPRRRRFCHAAPAAARGGVLAPRPCGRRGHGDGRGGGTRGGRRDWVRFHVLRAAG